MWADATYPAWGKKNRSCRGAWRCPEDSFGSPPVDGKANEALLRFLADQLSLPKQQVSLKSGQTSRRKVVEVQGLSAVACQARLLP